ncbi:glycosyltransferase family 4 protein [Bacillus sp. 165]|uniref:glycosyltransferase family 4 protein n=1 Tax=Bacillus sp. 165 TaxID=1529117 RepID=UPI001ADC6DAB|nr:glycosyltransferase family 4 protein [Bacillus sp. 165]MBO9129633.1 glycosyltransferase family 4 protein [Bacillus sp. 165]
MKALRILMLAWEYPPMIVGGLGRHVYELSKSLAKEGHSVHVITTFIEGESVYECKHNVHIHRVKSLYENKDHFYKWINGLNEAMLQYVNCFFSKNEFDLIHAHDWLVCTSAIAIKQKYNIPLITTIHATEHGRNNGIHTKLQYEIHMKEKELTQASDAIVVCSQYMKVEVAEILNASQQSIFVFPNGIDDKFFEQVTGSTDIRTKYQLENQKLVFSIGRIVNEKGFQTIVDAAPSVIAKCRNVFFIIAGKGPMLEYYRRLVNDRGLSKTIKFLGHITEEEQRAFLQQSDIVLVPSLYEPFGIVALEGMLAKKPTIVSDVGGLSEIISHGRTGYKMEPGNSHSLVQQITAVLDEKKEAEKIAQEGQRYVLEHYSWLRIAQQTGGVYRKIMTSYGKCRG